jgi:hypothetical protein
VSAHKRLETEPAPAQDVGLGTPPAADECASEAGDSLGRISIRI